MPRSPKPALPRLLLTPGEPAGIGPDLVIQLAQSRWSAELVAVCDPHLLAQRARQLKQSLCIEMPQDCGTPQRHRPGHIKVWPVDLATPVKAGRLDVRNAPYVLETLRLATRACLNDEAQGLVTGPVQKSLINEAGIPFSGHTEYLAQLTDAVPVMMLATPKLRVALATTHLPLREVPDALTPESLTQVLEVLHRDLRSRFGIARPRILVCGLNPHAGESGHLGREEIEIIEPVLRSLRKRMKLIGPLPADTLFTPKYLSQADAVLAMYHDQGLSPLKALGFGEAVNITLGLPILRTSVDHGTALDLAGSGKADASSLRAALKLALQLA